MRVLFSVLVLLSISTISLSQDSNLEKAYALANKGLYQKSLDVMKEVIKENPSVINYVFYSDLSAALGKTTEAFQVLDMAITQMPDSLVLYGHRGNLNKTYKNFSAALEDYQQVLKLVKKQKRNDLIVHAYTSIGGIKFNTRDYHGAYKIYKKALKINPNSLDALITISMVCDETGRPEETLKYLKKAIEIDPKNTTAYSNMGYKYQIMGDHENAIQNFNIAVELNPLSPYPYSNRSFSKLQLKDYEGAVMDIQKSIFNDASNSWAYKVRGLISVEMNEPQKACIDFQFAQELGYEKQYGPEVKELIQSYCTDKS